MRKEWTDKQLGEPRMTIVCAPSQEIEMALELARRARATRLTWIKTDAKRGMVPALSTLRQ